MMNYFFKVFLSFLLLTSCSSREELGTAKFDFEQKKLSVSLHSESLFNPDGLVKRSVVLEFPNDTVQEFDLHPAHYSDEVNLKKLEVSGKTYLIAEDKTGFTVWDFNKMKVIAQDDMDDNELTENPSGTARDYMTHKALSINQWLKLVSAKSPRKAKLVDISWQ